jgi:hypothetical protein
MRAEQLHYLAGLIKDEGPLFRVAAAGGIDGMNKSFEVVNRGC